MLKKIKSDILFLSLFIVFSALFYNGFVEFNELPKGIHSWKQSMHFSIIQNYANKSTDFWHPAIHNLFNTNNTGNLILEFPIFHYLTALIIQTFPSTTPVLFRWIIFFLTFLGFYHGYKLSYRILENKNLAVLTSILTYVIPIIVFYGANYLIDVPAMAFGFSTIYYFEKYYSKKNVINLIAGLVFFTLSGLLRLPVLILPLSYFIVSLIYRRNILYVLYLVPSIVIIFLWYNYVKKYNTYYVSYPPAETYNNLTPERVASTIHSIFNFMVYQFGWAYRYIVFYIVTAIFLFISRKNVSKFWFSVLLFSLIGSVIYVYLWFGIFEHHDYYLFPIVPLIFLLWLNVFFVVRNSHFKKHVVALALVVLLTNTINVFNNNRQRSYQKRIKVAQVLAGKYESGIWWYFGEEDKNKWKVFRDISPYGNSDLLSSNGIMPNDTIICDFDLSPTYSLALLNLKGWTAYNNNFQSLDDYEKYANMGAKYLFCNQHKKSNLDSIQLRLLKKNYVFQMDSLVVYNIKHLRSK